MARMRSAASTNLSSLIPHSLTTQQAPRPGTQLRKFYDLLMAHKGETVSYRPGRGMIRSLEDTYGLIIKPVCPGRYLLQGEWRDGEQVNFVSGR